MIAWLQGVVRERHPARVVLEVHGVGYELHVPVPTYARLPAVGAPATLFVHTHVREDAIQLFGFAGAVERAVFEKLLRVSGIGPKVALGLLAMDAAALSQAIQAGDIARLTALPGVGRKIAERLIVELRDKLGEHVAAGPAEARSAAGMEVVSALVNLGYAAPVADKAVQRAAVAAGGDANFETLFKEALKKL